MTPDERERGLIADLQDSEFDPPGTNIVRAARWILDQEIMLAERDAEIARLKTDLHGANDAHAAALAEVESLRKYLALARADIAAINGQPPPTPAEIRTYMDRLADQMSAGRSVPPATLDEIRAVMDNIGLQSRVDRSAPPIVVAPVDPRIDALCRVVEHLADIAWQGWPRNPAFPSELINDDLLTITRL